MVEELHHDTLNLNWQADDIFLACKCNFQRIHKLHYIERHCYNYKVEIIFEEIKWKNNSYSIWEHWIPSEHFSPYKTSETEEKRRHNTIDRKLWCFRTFQTWPSICWERKSCWTRAITSQYWRASCVFYDWFTIIIDFARDENICEDRWETDFKNKNKLNEISLTLQTYQHEQVN